MRKPNKKSYVKVNPFKLFINNALSYDELLLYVWKIENEPESEESKILNNYFKPIPLDVTEEDKTNYESNFHLIENKSKAELKQILEKQMVESEHDFICSLFTVRIYSYFQEDLLRSKLIQKTKKLLLSKRRMKDAPTLKYGLSLHVSHPIL